MEMTREEAIEILEEVKTFDDSMFAYSQMYNNALDMAIEALKTQEPITGETSDGYHTFNELYHHRAVLFSVIVANYPDRAWKSKKHHDGTMYDGMFIVGIDTPDGQATYHYDIDPYWDMFKCRVLDNAPEWDGHTPAQAIERIGKLKVNEPRVMTLEEVAALPDGSIVWFEDNNKPDVIVGLLQDVDLTANDYHIIVMIHFATVRNKLLEVVTAMAEDYGIRWRCWTSRPDEKRRAETPWQQ